MLSRRLLPIARLARGQNLSYASRNLAGLACVSQNNEAKYNKRWLYMGAAASVVASLALISQQNTQTKCDCENPAPRGHPASALPTFTYAEFKNDCRENIWVTMDGKPYNKGVSRAHNSSHNSSHYELTSH